MTTAKAFRDSCAEILREQAAQTRSELISYLTDPRGNDYKAVADSLFRLSAQVQLVAVANGDPLSFAGIDVSAVVGASERLTGLRGNTARMQWVAEGVAEFVAAEAASPVSDSSDEVPAGE